MGRQRGWFGKVSTLGVACVAATLAACGGGSGGDPATGTPPQGEPAASAPSTSAPTAASTSAASPASAAATTASAAATSAASGAVEASASSAGATDKAFADQVLAAVNAVRAVARKCGTADYPAAGPLKWHAQTEQAARTQAEYLQQNNLFSHTGANGSTVGDRLTATGYTWSTVGENIAAGFVDVPAVVKAWVDSPGHCVNLMNANFVDLGVVLVPGTSSNTYRTYWGMVLAKPR
jgi:uncharacterized protein YkwD